MGNQAARSPIHRSSNFPKEFYWLKLNFALGPDVSINFNFQARRKLEMRLNPWIFGIIFISFMLVQSFSCQPDERVNKRFIESLMERDHIIRAKVIQKINFDIPDTNADVRVLFKVSKIYQGSFHLDTVEVLNEWCAGLSFNHYKNNTEYILRLSSSPLDTVINWGSSWKYFKKGDILNYVEISGDYVVPRQIKGFPYYYPIEKIREFESKILKKLQK